MGLCLDRTNSGAGGPVELNLRRVAGLHNQIGAAAVGCVGVAGGCGKAGMAQLLLHGCGVGTALEGVGCVGMSKPVGRDGPGDAGALGSIFDDTVGGYPV